MSDDGDDSPPRPKRKVKRVVVVSSSESDSDENVIMAGSRRKKLRVLSDDDGTDSSGSSVFQAGTRRSRVLPKLRDSDADSDSSGWATERSATATAATSAAKTASGFTSDSSEGNSDKCSICLLRFTNQEVGTPESCEHIFCLDCILEWSKNVNTCPVDRMLFNTIVVRACAGGRVLRTQSVQVAERRPSLDTIVIEDLTVCELCGSTESEDTMLLCDRCDLGYHMQCLTPPLTEIPPGIWLCPNCHETINNDTDEAINISEIEDILDEFFDSSQPTGPRPSALRRARDTRRSQRLARSNQAADQPSTSRSRDTPLNLAPTRRATTRRKYKRRRIKTVVVEYEVRNDGKFPVTKRVTRKVKRRRTKKRQPRTAARRSHVRASVRARLATLAAEPRARAVEPSLASVANAELAVRRARAGIRPLNLLGDPNELEYFSDEGESISEVASTAVVRRPSASVLSAFRQARRKMVAIPSPPHASAAPDLLSDILEQQTLLHSKKSVMSVTRDGSVSIKLKSNPAHRRTTQEDKVDLSKASAGVKQTPSYPGGRGGGWGGGYRGTYNRDQTANFNRSGGYDATSAPRAQIGAYRGPTDNGARRDEAEYFDAFPRRPQYSSDDAYFERRRTAWQPYGPRPDAPPLQARHSFGGFENPVDMRMGQMPPADAPRPDKTQTRASLPYRPLTEPPVFNFPNISEVEKSEDERSDSGLVIDTEKYDPTEPTNDDDSGDESAPSQPVAPPAPVTAPVPPNPSAFGAAPAGVLPGNILDTAVRQVLKEARNLMVPPSVEQNADRSDDDSDGDCPNFSIYSAASVHIANSSNTLSEEAPRARAPSLEDLVQEDDTPPLTSPAASPAAPIVAVSEASPEPPTNDAPPASTPPSVELDEKRKSEEEYKEKVSKRCPITTNKRNPIKIKIHTPSLIKRQVSLYDEEEASPDADTEADAPDDGAETPPTSPKEDAIKHSNSDPVSNEVTDKCNESSNEISKENFKDAIECNDDEVKKEASPKIEEICEIAEQTVVQHAEEKPPVVKNEENNNENIDEVSETAAGEHSSVGASSDAEADSEPRSPAASREKMTESISETEDERSYTPCLDEQRPADEEPPIADLGTELISDEEGHDLFGEAERAPSASPARSPAPSAERAKTPTPERRRDKKPTDAVKKKKKKDSKREDKAKSKKKGEVSFKKLSKSGKERNYRERDGDARERRSASPRPRRRKDKRKDLERYDVRSVVSEKRRKLKDAFGRDVSPRARSPSRSPPRSASPARRSPSLARLRRSLSAFRRSPSRARKSPSRTRRSISRRRSASRIRRSPSPQRRSPSPRGRRSALGRKSSSRRGSVVRARSPSPHRGRRSPIRARRSASPVRRRSGTPGSPRRRKRRRSSSPAARSPPRRAAKKKKRPRGLRRAPPSPVRARRSPSPPSRPPSPQTPPPEADRAPTPSPRHRAEPGRRRRVRDHGGPSKEVFTSGDNILVSVSFKEQERDSEGERRRRRETRRTRRRRRRLAAAPEDTPKPVAIIDLERSPFRELTPSPKNVIVLSDSDPGERETAEPPAPAVVAPAPVEPAPAPAGPKTPPSPPSPAQPSPAPAPAPPPAAPSPDAYDPFEPTRSPSPAALAPASPVRPHMTLEAAQRSNLSADDVLARRPLTPVEKVMALLQSTREAEEAEAEAPPAPRIVLPSPTRAAPKLFPGKPSPIKSNPVKPMQATRLARVDDGASPYSPGSSDFGELFEPPPRRTRPTAAATGRKRVKTAVGVKMDDDNLKILDELPSSAVELQVKSKFLKKLNRQERVVEEVKLVLKPHYNKKRVTKDEYKDILRRAVPKICHNKSGEINPTKIQALVEAYVKKFRKKHKLGVA